MKTVNDYIKNEYTDNICQDKDCRFCRWLELYHTDLYCVRYNALVKFLDGLLESNNENACISIEDYRINKRWDKNGNILISSASPNPQLK